MWDDTHPAVVEELIERYRQMSPSDKLRMVAQMAETIRQLQLAEIRLRYPDADERECFLRMASRWVPSQLMKKFFNWDVDQMGY